MKTYQLALGLVVRNGMRTWRFDRQLNSEQPQFVFQDELTGEPKVYGLAQLQREVNNGTLDIVSGDGHDKQSKREQRLALMPSIRNLPARYEADLRRKHSYVAFMRRKGLTRGARTGITKALRELNGRMPMQPTGSNEIDLHPPTASSVMEWMRNLHKAGGSAYGLISGNVRRKARPRLPDPVREVCDGFIKKMYLNPARISLAATKVHIDTELALRARQGDLPSEKASVSESTLYRMVKQIDKFVVAKARFGASSANNEYRYGVRGARPDFVMQRYEIDHTILDIVVVCSITGMPLGRPTITVVIDAFSSYITGFFVSFWGTGLAATLSALKIAIAPKDDITESMGLTNRWLAYGIPAQFVVDNGLEFHSHDFQRAAMLLNCDVQYCAVRRPWLKPFVERAMREINASLPAAGRVHKPENNYLPPNPSKTAAVTFADLCRALIKLFVDVHPSQPNERTLTTPREAFREGMARVLPPMLPSSTAELDLIAAISDERTVTHDGVTVNWLTYRSEGLARLRRATGSNFRTMVKFNPEDLDAVYVQDPVSRSWLTVPSSQPEYTRGLSVVQHKAIRSALKGKLTASNAYGLLVQEKHALSEMWRSAVHFGKKLPKRVVQAQAGLTSSCAFHGVDQSEASPPTPDRLVESRAPATAVEEAYEEYESISF